MLFAVMVVAAFGLPATGYFWLQSQATGSGYDIAKMPGLFSLQAFTLANPSGCGG
jgi:hypothetical protein